MNRALKFALANRKRVKPTLFDSGIGARLPEAYKKFYDEWRNTPPAPVHYIPREGSIWKRHPETGEIKRVENIPIPLKFPKELNNVFTGGEAIIQGFRKKNRKYTKRVPRFWTPAPYENVVYSEILNKYFSILSTRRVIDLITEHEGFDNYILKTKACDLQSLIALKIKQKLLKALSDKNLPYDEEKNKKILQKYEKYLIPPEEIEWYSLSFGEACRKQKEIEEEKAALAVTPLKHFYRAELIKYLQNEGKKEPETAVSAAEKTSWREKLPSFLNLAKK